MSYNPAGIGSISFQAQTTYGTAASGSMTALECDAVLPSVTRELFTKDAIIKQGHYYFAPVDGSQHGSNELSISMPLHGYSSTGHQATPTAHAEALFLQSLMGSLHTATKDPSNSITDAGASTGTINVDGAATMSHFAAGQARAVTNAAGVYNVGFVTAVDGSNDLTLLNNLASNNEVDSPILSSLNCFLSTVVAPTFFTFEWQGLQATGFSKVVLEGCVPTSCEITLDAKAQPMISFAFMCNSATTTTGTIADQSYTLPIIPAAIGANGARMMRGNNEIAVSGLTVSIEATHSAALNHNKSQGVGAMLCTDRTATATFTELLDSSTDATSAISGADASPLMLQIGNTAGAIFAMCIPAPQLLEIGELADQEGIIGQARTYGGTNYTGDTATGGAASPDPADSDFRIAFL